MTKLTVAAIEKLKVRGITPNGIERTRLEYHDGGGLYLVVQKSGHKSWALRFKRCGKSAKHTGGPYSAKGSPDGTPKAGDPMNLVEARAWATSTKMQINRGVDPIAERRTASVKASLTGFARAAQDYVEQWSRSKKRVRTWWKIALVLGLDYDRDAESHSPKIIAGGLADRWMNKPVAEITDADVFAVVDEAASKAIPGRKATTKGRSDSREREMINALSGMFKYLRKRQLVAAALPTAGLEREKSGERSRVLDHDELRRLWAAIPDTVLGRVIKVMTLTGTRPGEVAGMRWSELSKTVPQSRNSFDTWTIPGERTKNGEEHAVPLTQMVLELLDSSQNKEHDFVFTTTGKTPVSGFGKLKRRLDAELQFSVPWQFRDIRRTVATNMGEMGIEPHIVEEILGHVAYKAGVQGLYNRAGYEPRKRKALERWANRIEAIIEGREEQEAVVEMRA